MESIDEFKAILGAWIDVIGTVVSAIAETRAFLGFDQLYNFTLAIGEGFQALGELIVSTSGHDGPLFFLGSWINAGGAATSSVSAYLSESVGEEAQYVKEQILGDSLQSMGSFLQSLGDYSLGNYVYSAGNALQSFGAGLEAIAGNFELRNSDDKAKLLAMVGSWFQASGANVFAIELTKNTFMKEIEQGPIS